MVRDLAQDAAEIGWPETIRTLLGFIRPWRRLLTFTVGCGIGRVVAFIGVSVLGALIIAAVRANPPTQLLVVLLLAAAPAPALLHWLESFLAHDMAYRLLAVMRIDLYRKLDALAPAYLLKRRSGDLVALATQDVETIEYFYAHTVAPAFVAVLIPGAVLVTLAVIAWPLALALLPFLAYAAGSPVLGRRRIDRLASTARRALGELGAHATETIQGLAELIAFEATTRRRDEFMAYVRRYQAMRLALLHDLTRQTAGLEVATGLGGLAVAAVGAFLVMHGWIAPTLLPLLVLISIAAFLPVSEIAQVGRQLADTIASTRRLHVVHSEPVVITDGPVVPAAPRGGSTVASSMCASPIRAGSVPRWRMRTSTVPAGATVALVGPSGAGKTTIANLLLRFWDPEQGAIRLDGVDLRELTLDGLRGRIALVAQDTYLFNDTLEANVRLAKPDATRQEIETALRQAALAEFVAESAGWIADARGRARRAAFRWPAPAHRDRARVPEGRADPGARRGDLASRHDQRAACAVGARCADGEPHHDRGGASAVHHTGRRRDPGAERGPRDRGGHAQRTVRAARVLCAAGRAPDGWRCGAAGGELIAADTRRRR